MSTERNQRFIAAYKETMCCAHCSESRPVCLQFHHPKPVLRKYHFSRFEYNRHDVSYWVHKHASLGKLVEMIEQCQLLCANCHAVETARLKG